MAVVILSVTILLLERLTTIHLSIQHYLFAMIIINLNNGDNWIDIISSDTSSLLWGNLHITSIKYSKLKK